MPPLGSRLACGCEGKNSKKTVVARSSIFERRPWSCTVKSLGLWGKNMGWLRKIDRCSPAAPLRSPSVEKWPCGGKICGPLRDFFAAGPGPQNVTPQGPFEPPG